MLGFRKFIYRFLLKKKKNANQIFSRPCFRGMPHLNKFQNLYTNMPMQYTAIFHACKNEIFLLKNYEIFLIFAQNIDGGYTLELPQ